jgi:hypothetical protein
VLVVTPLDIVLDEALWAPVQLDERQVWDQPWSPKSCTCSRQVL